MNIHTLYELSTGRIVGQLQVPVADLGANTPEGMTTISGGSYVDPATHYVVDGLIVERPVLPVTHTELVVDTDADIVFSNIPPGATFFHPEGEAVIDDGSVSWGSDIPGLFILRIELFPYTEGYYRVTVN